jgi:hypothetical protein
MELKYSNLIGIKSHKLLFFLRAGSSGAWDFYKQLTHKEKFSAFLWAILIIWTEFIVIIAVFNAEMTISWKFIHM